MTFLREQQHMYIYENTVGEYRKVFFYLIVLLGKEWTITHTEGEMGKENQKMENRYDLIKTLN